MLILAVSFSSCKKERFPLQGTKWKLAGIVDGNGNLKVLKPQHCDICYTLTFYTDYKATVINIGTRLKLNLRKLHSGPYNDSQYICERYDKDGEFYCDSDIFRHFINSTKAYYVTPEVLSLFSEYGGNSYLSFIPYHGETTTLRGTKWKLAGVVDAQTGVIKEFEPKKCVDCYTLTFRGDSIFSARSISEYMTLDLSELDLFSISGISDNACLPNCTEQWSSFWNWNEIGDDLYYEDGCFFRCIMAHTESYNITNDELKLYFVYQEKNYYLLFKLVYS